MQKYLNREEKLQAILETEKHLGEIQDVDVLFESILTEARNIVNADAGSIYIVDHSNLKIRYAQNDTNQRKLEPGKKLPYTYFAFPINKKSIAGYVALSGEPLNIQDAYDLPKDMPFSFNSTTDQTIGYRTKSIYTIPLKVASGRTLGVLQIINAQNESGEVIPFDADAELFLNHFANNATQTLEHAYLTSNMVKRMMSMAEFRDPKETYPHVIRVSEFSLEIYDRYAFNHNIPPKEQHLFRDNLKIAAKFHDAGKVGISDIILKKKFPRFTAEERSVMQTHTCIGGRLFADGTTLLDKMSSEVALHHHERWDGGPSGYPGKIDLAAFEVGKPIPPDIEPMKGEEIPLSARIVAVADVFDALSHKRSYKEAWTIDDAFSEIINNSGKQFDPEIVKAFIEVRDRICAIQLAYPDDDN
ncbi:MAG: GAF domain-containing protein [Treponema sp.]|nr:GAF domain-containing protein [Treponema sp.]